MAKRDPRTPGCSIDGCPRAARRLGLCDSHARLLPADFGIRSTIAVLHAQMEATREQRRLARFEVLAVLARGQRSTSAVEGR